MSNKHFGGSCRFIEQGGCQGNGERRKTPGRRGPAWPHGSAVGYSSSMLRRTFLQTLPAAAAAMTAAAAEEVPVKLGFDTYSVRAFKWKGTQLLDYAAGLSWTR